MPTKKADKLVLTYEQIGMASEGLQSLQQVYMVRAGAEPEAAQRAMDLASVNNHLLAEIGSLTRNKEILLAQYGVPQPGPQGRTSFILKEDEESVEAYRAGLESLMLSTRTMPFERIKVTPGDLQALSSRPDILGMLQPIVVFVPAPEAKEE